MYVIVAKSRVVCIDTGVGTASYGQWLTDWLARQPDLGPQVASRPILVINTHCHFECAAFVRSEPRLTHLTSILRPPHTLSPKHARSHVGGNASLAPPRSEAIAASARDPEFTRAAFDVIRDASLAREVGCDDLAQYTVTRWLVDGEVIRLGGRRRRRRRLAACAARTRTHPRLARAVAAPGAHLLRWRHPLSARFGHCEQSRFVTRSVHRLVAGTRF